MIVDSRFTLTQEEADTLAALAADHRLKAAKAEADTKAFSYEMHSTAAATLDSIASRFPIDPASRRTPEQEESD